MPCCFCFVAAKGRETPVEGKGRAAGLVAGSSRGFAKDGFQEVKGFDFIVQNEFYGGYDVGMVVPGGVVRGGFGMEGVPGHG